MWKRSSFLHGVVRRATTTASASTPATTTRTSSFVTTPSVLRQLFQSHGSVGAGAHGVGAVRAMSASDASGLLRLNQLPVTGTNTKIVCTLGPATDKAEPIGLLVTQGMHVARLNFSHAGTYRVQYICVQSTVCTLLGHTFLCSALPPLSLVTVMPYPILSYPPPLVWSRLGLPCALTH
jgi:hypothetical protein